MRRIYGDFSGTRLSLADILQTHAIMPHQIRLYLGQERVRHRARDRRDGPAPQRPLRRLLPGLLGQRLHPPRRAIREQGVDVYGFGEQKTPESFRQACRRFIYTENLLPEAPTPSEPERADTDRLRNRLRRQKRRPPPPCR